METNTNRTLKVISIEKIDLNNKYGKKDVIEPSDYPFLNIPKFYDNTNLRYRNIFKRHTLMGKGFIDLCVYEN